jgi:signal transduction histidine kinase
MDNMYDLAENELQKEKRKTEIIRQLATVVNRPATLKEKLDAILEVLESLFGLQHSMLLLPDFDTQKLQVFSSRGFDRAGIGAEVAFGEGIIGVVAQRKKKLRMGNISRQFRLMKTMANHQADELKVALPGLPDVESQVALPLLANDELVAVLSAESRDINFFSTEDEAFLMTLSQLIAISIQNALVMDQLEQKVQERTAALEQKKIELEKANAGKDMLFSIIGHDLRSPAASLQNVAELISFYNKKGDSEQLNATGTKVVKAAKNINFLLDNLLQWSLSQRGELQIRPEKISLPEMVHEVLEIYRDMAEAKGIQLEVLTSEDLYVLADKNACLTILRNLISNALKFTHAGGCVKILLESKQETVRLCVSDTGTGIPPEMMAMLFELKEQKSTKGTAKEKGTGLGLVLVREMLRLNQGDINISSVAGKGTSVNISLPFFQET